MRDRLNFKAFTSTFFKSQSNPKVEKVQNISQNPPVQQAVKTQSIPALNNVGNDSRKSVNIPALPKLKVSTNQAQQLQLHRSSLSSYKYSKRVLPGQPLLHQRLKAPTPDPC